jgi:hypothetical protein
MSDSSADEDFQPVGARLACALWQSCPDRHRVQPAAVCASAPSHRRVGGSQTHLDNRAEIILGMTKGETAVLHNSPYINSPGQLQAMLVLGPAGPRPSSTNSITSFNFRFDFEIPRV